jgi:hypothetical protein
MKKILVTFVAIVILIATAFIFLVSSGGQTVLTGHSLECENDIYMIIDERGSPIRYSYKKALGTDVEKLTDGDRILIISDLINESYPGSTSARFILKLEDGDISDIPEATLRSLSELGWYKFTE